MNRHIWAIWATFDWGGAFLWSGWDTRRNSPEGELMPILFRTRRMARHWCKSHRSLMVKMRPVKVIMLADE